MLAQMEVQNRDVLVALKAATEEAAAARRALAAAQEEGRKRDTLVLKNQQLESARHFDRVAQASGAGAAQQQVFPPILSAMAAGCMCGAFWSSGACR